MSETLNVADNSYKMNNSIDYNNNTLHKQLDELRNLWNIHIAGIKAKDKANALIYFLDKHNILTHEDIGRIVGISKQRVGRIVQQIEKKKRRWAYLMIHKIDMGDNFKTVKTFVFGLALGAIAVALTLDNCFGAMVKAFQHPMAVNEMNIQLQISQK